MEKSNYSWWNFDTEREREIYLSNDPRRYSLVIIDKMHGSIRINIPKLASGANQINKELNWKKKRNLEHSNWLKRIRQLFK